MFAIQCHLPILSFWYIVIPNENEIPHPHVICEQTYVLVCDANNLMMLYFKLVSNLLMTTVIHATVKMSILKTMSV